MGKTTKAKPTEAAPRVWTVAEELAMHRADMEGAIRARVMYWTGRVEAYQKETAADPLSAFTRCGAEMVAAATKLRATRWLFDGAAGKYDGTPQEFRLALGGRVKELTRDLLDGDSYDARSTSPLHNLVEVAAWGARQEELRVATAFAWWLDRIAELEALDGAAQVTPHRCPVNLYLR